jgi:hypothetical protein
MNPNSVNQVWSRWTATVVPDRTRALPSHEQVRDNCARFYRKAFGSATELHIVASPATWTIDCRTEGHPAHDPNYQAYMTSNLQKFLLNGFGPRASIQFDVRLEAGSRQDGTPPDQLIIGPPAVVLQNSLLQER